MTELLDLLRSGGPAMLPIALGSLAAWWLVFEAALRRPDEDIESSLPTELSPLVAMQLIASCRRSSAGRLRIIASLAAALPLLGLLGTVLGMILTFDALDGGSSGAAQLAQGVSAALLTTQAGLVLALPVLIAERFLNARARRSLSALEYRLQSRIHEKGGN